MKLSERFRLLRLLWFWETPIFALRCSFCAHDEYFLVAGPGVSICEKCVDAAAGFVAEERERREIAPPVPESPKLATEDASQSSNEPSPIPGDA